MAGRDRVVRPATLPARCRQAAARARRHRKVLAFTTCQASRRVRRVLADEGFQLHYPVLTDEAYKLAVRIANDSKNFKRARDRLPKRKDRPAVPVALARPSFLSPGSPESVSATPPARGPLEIPDYYRVTRNRQPS